jgi:hypothetical protein
MGNFTLLQKGSSEIIKKPAKGKTGNFMPNIQIFLEDGLRVSIWLNDKGDAVNWQYVRDDRETRAKWDASRNAKKNADDYAAEKKIEEAFDDDLPF